MQDSNVNVLEDYKVFEFKLKVHADVNGMHVNSVQFCDDFNALDGLAKADLYQDIIHAVSEKQNEDFAKFYKEIQDRQKD